MKHISNRAALIALFTVYGCGGAPSLTSAHAGDRYDAITSAEIKDKEQLKQILGYISDESRLVRLGVVERYARFGTIDYIDRIIPSLDDPSWEVRRETVRLVCDRKYAPAWQKLLKMAHDDKNDLVRIEIVRGATGLAAREEAALLLKSLESDRSPSVRFHAREQLKSVAGN